MSFFPILPPFPFPDRWLEVNLQQQVSGDKKWLVPSPSEIEELVRTYAPQYVPNANAKVQQLDIPHQNTGCGELRPDELNCNEEDGEEYETFELNPIWAARFSKTIKRMKQKVHKAKRRADWKKK